MTAALAANSALPLAKKAEDESGAKTLYVKRPLTNASTLRAWAKAAGFKATLPESDMHVTLAHSSEPVDWGTTVPAADRMTIPPGGARTVERLGDKGAVVLRFESPELSERWQELVDAGAKWDHPGYKPHVTISYEADGVDLSAVEPYEGQIDLAPEVFDEVKKGWANDLKHVATDSAVPMAMDRDSVRMRRRDGQLVVEVANISKANVCPYRGEEIPGWKELGLEKERVYNLLRDPEELRKGAGTSNGVQLLIVHKPVSAEDHRPNETVGSLGTDAEFDGTYVTNSLFVNAKTAIEGIESGKQRELSAGYHYKPDMTPGIFRGTGYDGVMRDIVFNHVALVEDGRAGPDVVVGDEALKENDAMTKATRFGALTLSFTAAAIAPLLAMDQKATLPKDLFIPLTSKNFKDNREKLLAGVRLALDGKLRKGLALDATMKDLAKVVDAFPDDIAAGIDEPAPEDKQDLSAAATVEPAKAIAEPGSTYDAEPMKAFMKQCGMDDASIAKCMDMMPKPALDESPEDKEAREKKEKEAAAAKDAELKAKDAEMKDMVSKPAMDAALKAQAGEFDKRLQAVRDNERGVRIAIEEVRPYVGDLPATMAFDTAADVLRHVLVMKGVDGAKDLHADALKPILASLPKAGARAPEGGPTLAMDTSVVAKAVKFAPGLEGITVI